MTEPAGDDQVEAVQRRFRRKPVAILEQLQRALGSSERTVFRVLDRVGYVTSYSHAGRYYTLKSIPVFDEHGLWFYGEVRFSARGTLRATLVFLIREAPGGHTHEEFEALVGLRVHNTLKRLVETHQIGRERVAALFVYVDADPERAAAQIAQRRERERQPTSPSFGPHPPLDLARVVDVLLAVIHPPRKDARGIAAHLRATGVVVDDEQVEEVFVRSHVKKKTGRSRSRRSRR